MKSQCIQFLLQFSVTICDKFTVSYQDLNQQFYATCHGVDKFSVWRKLKGIVETNNDPKVDSLRIAQHTTKMVISMMKNEGSYVEEDLQSLMQSLSLASKTMSDIDGSMFLTSGYYRGKVFQVIRNLGSLKPISTLASLVKEAQQLVDQKKKN